MWGWEFIAKCDRNGATAEWNKWQQKINRRKNKKQKTETHQMHFGKEWKKILKYVSLVML